MILVQCITFAGFLSLNEKLFFCNEYAVYMYYIVGFIGKALISRLTYSTTTLLRVSGRLHSATSAHELLRISGGRHGAQELSVNPSSRLSGTDSFPATASTPMNAKRASSSAVGRSFVESSGPPPVPPTCARTRDAFFRALHFQSVHT